MCKFKGMGGDFLHEHDLIPYVEDEDEDEDGCFEYEEPELTVLDYEFVIMQLEYDVEALENKVDQLMNQNAKLKNAIKVLV